MTKFSNILESLIIANESSYKDNEMLKDYILQKIALRQELKKYGYVENLLKYLYTNNTNCKEFENQLNTSIKNKIPMPLNDNYYKSVKNTIVKNDLVYIGSHQNIAVELFYNLNTHKFNIIDIESGNIDRYSYSVLLKLAN